MTQIVKRVEAGGSRESRESRESPLPQLTQLSPPNVREVVSVGGYVYGESKPERLKLDPKALIGPAGNFVESFSPITEAHPFALLMHYLTSFGNQIGKTAFITLDGHDHHGNLYSAVIGETSRSRKGTAGRRFDQVFREAVPLYAGKYLNGLSTGEGVLKQVADPTDEEEGEEERKKNTLYKESA